MKQKYKNTKIAPKQYEFNKNNVQQPLANQRTIYIVLHCIPIPLIKKINPSGKVLISLNVDKDLTIKSLFKVVTEYLKYNLEFNGYNYMKSSSKMIISEQNHQAFICNDPEIME